MVRNVDVVEQRDRMFIFIYILIYGEDNGNERGGQKTLAFILGMHF